MLALYSYLTATLHTRVRVWTVPALVEGGAYSAGS